MFPETLEIFLSPIVMQIGVILFLTITISYSVKHLLQRLESSNNTPEMLKLLYQSWHTSLHWLIGIYGVFFAIETLASYYLEKTPARLIQIRSIYAVCAATWLLFCWKSKFEALLIKRAGRKKSSANDKALIFAIGKLVSIAICITSGIMLLQVFAIRIDALLAFGGIGGLAISWAGKDVVANLFGGLMIYLQRPFAVGDWIYSPNKNFEGTVEDIGWYMTRIRTFERRPTYIPNALITDAIVENPQRMYNRRIKETVGIRYQDVDKTKEIVDDIENMLRNHPAIDQNQTLMVHLVGFGPHSLNIEIYTFTKTTVWKEWRDIQQGVFLKVSDIIASYGAEIAFPTSTIHLESEKPKTFSQIASQAVPIPDKR